ncbi:MAG TPA: Hsp20/alpha crystallin family protein [Candidatus Udaeobacter sp.]|nr:Hsp20/alpha crystallin family protein [Candidatus Udaeobacter sp.]
MSYSEDPSDALQRELERLFHDLIYQRHPASHFGENAWQPATDVMVSADGARIVLELAGVPRENVHVRLLGRTLEVTGMRPPLPEARGTRYHRAEIFFGDFRRAIELPWEVNGDVRARFRNGLLEILLTRSQVPMRTNITVEHGAEVSEPENA